MYNGPSGPRRLLTMVISSARAAVAANIALTAKQIILLALILIPFRLARLENLNGPIKFINLKDRHRHGISINRIETSSLLHDCRVGLRAEIRASLSRADSCCEIILVRFYRLRAW